MNNQITIFDMSEEARRTRNAGNTPDVVIFHESLSSCWCECPACKNTKGMIRRKAGYNGEWYTETDAQCPECGQPLLWDWDLIDKKAKKSKDVIECEKLGLHGAVKKDGDGKWVKA